MEAVIKIQLTEGLTPSELGAFIRESELEHKDVSEVITDALRDAARRFRLRQSKRAEVIAAA